MRNASPSEPDEVELAQRSARRRIVWAGVGIALGVFFAAASQLRMLLDDSFITYRYAANLARGEGMVFNPGERVEGYTNFLWVVVLSGVTKLGADVVLVSQWLGIGAGAFTVVLAYRLASDHANSTWAGVGAAFVLAAYPGFVLWAGSGMETAMFTMLVTLATLLYLQRPTSMATGVVVALAAMTRPEGLIWGAAFAISAVIRRDFVLTRWRWLGVAALGFTPYYVWRFSYFGYPLPNTFYAKTGSDLANVSIGMEYAGKFILEGGAALLLLAALSLTSDRRRLTLFAPLTLMVFSVIVATGGDFMASHRFFIPLLPTLCALAATGLTALWRQASVWPKAAGTAVALAGVTSAALDYPAAWKMKEASTLLCDVQRLVGANIDNRAGPGESFASIGVGVLAFYTDRHVIDLVGVTDKHIAHRDVRMGATVHGHEKSDTEYVLKKNPAFVLIPVDVPGFPSLPAMRGLQASHEFATRYVYEGFGTFRRRDVRAKD